MLLKGAARLVFNGLADFSACRLGGGAPSYPDYS